MADVSLKNFEFLSEKLASLVYSRCAGDRLMTILDDFLRLDFDNHHYCVGQNSRGVLLINQCCYLVPHRDTELVSKASTLFTKLLVKQNVIVEAKTLSLALEWCLECLKHQVTLSVLQFLKVLTSGVGCKIEENCNDFLQKLNIPFQHSNYETDEDALLYLQYLKCLESFVYVDITSTYKSVKSETLQEILTILQNVLLKEPSHISEIIHCQLLIASMKGIGYIVQQSNDILTDTFGENLGFGKGYMLYGLPEQKAFKIEKILPSQVSVPDTLKPPLPHKIKGKYDKKSKNKPISSIDAVEDSDVQDDVEPGIFRLLPKDIRSDSEYSDNDSQTNQTKLRSLQCRVRLCALVLINTMIDKASSKALTGYLASLLPDGSQVPQSRTLMTCLLKDPSPRCRREVISIVSALLTSCRLYFTQADSISHSSFTSWASSLAAILKELHRCLALALISEQRFTILYQILRCISDLIRCSPYKKLEPGLVSRLARHVKPLLKHKDINVKTSTLIVYGCIVSIDPGPSMNEIKCLIINPLVARYGGIAQEEAMEDEEHEEAMEEDEEEEEAPGQPWLLDVCMANIMEKDGSNVSLIIESLQVLGALVRNYFKDTVVNHHEDILELILHCANRTEYPVRLYSAKFMETVLHSIEFNLAMENGNIRMDLAMKIWNELLTRSIPVLLGSKEPMLRASGCDCLVSIGVETSGTHSSSIFEQLSEEKQILCVTSLFSALKDESPAVRSSAARALAVLVSFPQLRKDSLFLLDSVDAVLSISRDLEPSVKFQASWLLGNLSESVVANKSDGDDNRLPDDVYVNLLQTGMRLASDSPKVKPGAVRALGNLVRVMDDRLLKNNRELVLEVIEMLIKNATSGNFMKARWNSCYALGNALLNMTVHTAWRHKIYSSLLQLMEHYKNFKVRIGAACVLCSRPSREGYGDLYLPVWSAVLNSLENSKNVSDLQEYQHRDQLVDQLCLLLCHLVSEFTPADLLAVSQMLLPHLDNVKDSMGRYNERVVPEKSEALLKASDTISTFVGASDEHRRALALLRSIFNQRS